MSIRTQIMNLQFNHWDECKELSLSVNQIDLLILVRGCQTMRSGWLAEYRNISIQSASGSLTRLYRRGYLQREEEADPTGGRIYVYRLSDNLSDQQG